MYTHTKKFSFHEEYKEVQKTDKEGVIVFHRLYMKL